MDNRRRDESGSCRIVVLTSGKGGVGKTTTAVNVAATLAAFGYRVALLDAAFGLGDVAIRLGLTPSHTMAELLNGKATVDDVLIDLGEGLSVLPAATGMPLVTTLDREQQRHLDEAVAALEARFDYLIVDTPSGLGPDMLAWLERGDDVLIITTEDQAAILDAYAVIKLAARLGGGARLSLAVNEASSEAAATEVHASLASTAAAQLGLELPMLGGIERDPLVSEAGQLGEAVVSLNTTAPASLGYRRIARRLIAAARCHRNGEVAKRATCDTDALEPVAR